MALTQAQLNEWLSCSLKEMDVPVVMIDGIHFRERVILIALGIDAQGRALRDARDGANAALAAKQLQRLAASLQAKHPGAAASLREGLDETRHSRCSAWGSTARCTARCARTTRSRTSTARSRTYAQRQALEGRRDDAGWPARWPTPSSASAGCAGIAT